MTEMMNDEIKHQIQEMQKCFNDITYFSSNYYTIVHPIKGLIHLDLYDFQKQYFKEKELQNKNIYICSRQLGMTTINNMYCLWSAIFKPGKCIYYITNSKQSAICTHDNINSAHNNLPYWLKKELVVNNQNKMVFRNGASINILHLTADCMRGTDPDEIIIEDFAFANPVKAEKFWESTYPLIMPNKKITVFSVPHRKNDFFHKLCNTHGYKELDWSVHPERNDDWMDGMIENIGEVAFKKEYECKF